jgi:hypothetical protein
MSRLSPISPFLRVLNEEVNGFEKILPLSKSPGEYTNDEYLINVEIKKLWRKLSKN